MGQPSEIEWTDATWNPVTGCTKIGPGCDNCYAQRFAERWRGIEGHPYEQGFDLRLWPSRLHQPSQWKKPRMIFVNSMSDLFHKRVDRQFINKVFDAMESANWHVYQILTNAALSCAAMFVNAITVKKPLGTSGLGLPSRTRLTRAVLTIYARSIPKHASYPSSPFSGQSGRSICPVSHGQSSAVRVDLRRVEWNHHGQLNYGTDA